MMAPPDGSTAERRVRPAEGVELILLDDEGLLFAAASQRLFGLNPAATCVWCLLDEDGTSETDLADRVAATLRIATRSAADYVETALGQLGELGLLHRAEAGRHAKPLGKDPTPAHKDGCAAGDAGQEAHEDMVPGEHPTRPAAQGKHLLGLHAAGVTCNAGTLLLPGASGAGKTVLTASLLAAGWEYLTDDTVMVSSRFQVVGMPYPLAVKAGAWELLAGCCPELEEAKIHIRPDGQPVRYLRRKPARGGDIGPVRWLVFPFRTPERCDGSLIPLRPSCALTRLLDHCCAIPGDLGTGDVRGLARWVAGMESFELRFTEAREAVERLNQLPGRDPATVA
jgi:hypothetical protein